MNRTAVGERAQSRRTHNKSRQGCSNCKRRHIKCDETKPSCSNCANHAIECPFSINGVTESESPAAFGTESSVKAPHTQRSYRFRSYQYRPGTARRSAKSPQVEDRPQESTELTGPECEPSFSQFQGWISVADLQLFHHFTITVSSTIADDVNAHDFWQNHVIQWSFTFPSILHLILALSALHLGHERPSLRDTYFRQADDHFSFGVRSVTAVMSQLDVNNCQRVYISAVLICFVYFGRGPRPGEYLVFSDRGHAEWLVLMNGVKLILQSYQEKVFSGILEPKGEPVCENISPSVQSELREHTSRIHAVQQLVEQHVWNEADRGIYGTAINNLLETLTEVYKKRSAQIPAVGLMQVLVGWLYRLPKEFVYLLEKKEPLALVVLAHWGMLLKGMRSVWFMKGWDEHVLSGVRASLPLGFQQWIEWPEWQVQQNE